jgi:hypothetical protein
MTETLLSTSNVLLFGRVVEDLMTPGIEVDAASDVHVPPPRQGLGPIDGVNLVANNLVLLNNQDNDNDNGIWLVTTAANNPWEKQSVQPPDKGTVKIKGGTKNKGAWRKRGNKFGSPRLHGNLGKNRFLESQLEDTLIARIYGFSYEGAYFDLAHPVLFLVHGPGSPAVQSSQITGPSNTVAQLARAPREPSISGVAAADFGIADDIMVWSYDKADYTVRMDVETGMFEQVLLDAYFADGGHVSGMKVSGMKVSGMKVAGMKVAGMKVAGSRLGRGDASD